MAKYLAMRIIQSKLDYSTIVTLYPEFKVGIDEVLVAENQEDLIV